MSSQEIVDFTPPPQELGGKNLVSYFAMLLFNQIIAMRAVDYGVIKFQETPVFQNAPHIFEETNRIEEHLKSLHLFFHEPDGSIFMDYKRMRKKRFPVEGQLSSWEKKQIKISMSTEEALEICNKEVSTWWNLK